MAKPAGYEKLATLPVALDLKAIADIALARRRQARLGQCADHRQAARLPQRPGHA